MKAMILAAGLGKRMGELTKDTPKPLIKVGSKTLLQLSIEHLIKGGIKDIIINSHYKYQQIRSFLDNNKFDANIKLVVEDEIKDTGTGVFDVLPFFDEEPFVITSADIVSNINYNKLTMPSSSTAHMVMVENPDFHLGGDFCINDEKLTFNNKGYKSYTYSNIGLFRKEFFDLNVKRYQPLRTYIDHAVSKNKVTASIHKGFWYNVGTPEQLKACSEAILEMDYEKIP